MQVTKEYKRGGFFGNSQAKFSHMAGADGGFNRKEFRDLRRRKRRGESLSGTEGQRLNYMKNVRQDRIKKGIAGAALAGTAAAVAGPALAAQLGGKGLSGIAGKLGGKGAIKGALGKLKGKGALKKAMKVQQALGDSGFFRGTDSATANSGQYGGAPETAIEDMQLGAMEEFDAAPDDNFDYDAEATGPQLQEILGGISNLPFLKYGGKMRVLKEGGLVGGQKRLDKNNDGKLTKEDFALLRAMLGARIPR